MRDLTHAGVYLQIQLGASKMCWVKSSILLFFTIFWVHIFWAVFGLLRLGCFRSNPTIILLLNHKDFCSSPSKFRSHQVKLTKIPLR